MTKTHAFWRLFPASLFTILGLAWCYLWRFDPVLIGIAVCIAALASSWFAIAIIEVAKTLIVAPSSPAEGAATARGAV